MDIKIFQKTFILTRLKVASFIDIIKVLTIFIITIFKDSDADFHYKNANVSRTVSGVSLHS